MDSSRRCRSWASNLGVPGPIRARAGPPGPQSRNQPSRLPESMDQLTALHKAGLDGYQLNSLPESIGQLGWETVSKPCPGEPSRLDHSGATAGGEDTSLTSMRNQLWTRRWCWAWTGHGRTVCLPSGASAPESSEVRGGRWHTTVLGTGRKNWLNMA